MGTAMMRGRTVTLRRSRARPGGRYARPSMASMRRPVAARLALSVLTIALACAACNAGGGTATTQAPTPAERLIPLEQRAVARAEKAVAVHLPTSPGEPAPRLPDQAFRPPLAPHQVVGFFPYWEVGSFKPDYQGLTTLVYFAVDLDRSGSIAHGGVGWSTLTNPALALAIRGAHAAGDRVLLTIFSDSATVLHSIASSPSTAGARLARQTALLLRAGSFDGVDLDLEGRASADRAGFVRFVASFSSVLKSLDATWSLMLNTYPTSAFDPVGFFNIKALLPHVDELFVMAYEMQDNEIPSATAPLSNASLDDAMTLAEYASVVPADRIVLGIPLYGYDFPASSKYYGAGSTGPPVAVTYSSIVAAGRPPKWDPVTETAWTAFRRAGKWHQTWFDDPVSIALKSALAAQFACAGVGVWELGMSGGDPAISAALLGGSPAVKLPLATG